MKQRREQLVFLVLLLIAVLLAWSRLDGRYARQPVPRARTLEPAQIELPRVIRRGGADPSNDAGLAAGAVLPLHEAGADRRMLFAPPRELLPLDPLELPDPPRPALSVLRPAVHPARGGGASRAYRVRPETLGGLALDDTLPGDIDGNELDPAEGLIGIGGGGGPGLGRAPASVLDLSDADFTLDEPALEDRFDWYARVGSTGEQNRIYGHIRNDDPHGLARRRGEDLLFQQVSRRTGRTVGVPFSVPRLEVDGFGLALTFENAYRFRTRALGNGPSAAAPRRELAEELLASWPGESQAHTLALEEARRAWAASPGDPHTGRLLAWMLYLVHDVESELALYHDALDEGWADAALFAGFARLARGLGLPERAWELVQQGRRLDRVSGDVTFVEGLLLRDRGDHEGALAAFQAAAGQPWAAPDVVGKRRRLALELGASWLAADQPREALREADRLLLEQPDDVEALNLRGAALMAEGDVAGAAEQFGSALAVRPDDPVVLTNSAIAAWREGDGAAAMRLLSQAREVDPLNAVRPTLVMGFLHEDAGQPEAARDLYAEALALEPGDPEALYRLGRNQRHDGNPEAAVETLRTALQLTGPETLLLLELGRAALERGRQEHARRYFREGLRLEPQNGEVLWYQGLAALEAGDLFAADAPLRAAAATGMAGAHAGLAVAAYRRGEVAAASDHFDEVLKAYAGDSDAPVARYAAEQSARIADNLAKRQWIERFGRSSLQRGWRENQWDGSPRVLLDGGAVRIAGRMEKPREDERPGISRDVDGRAFHTLLAELVVETAGETRCGVSLTHRAPRGSLGSMPKARLDIFMDEDGLVRTSVLDSFDTIVRQGEPLDGVRVEPGTAVRLGIERLDAINGRFAFTVDGQPVGDLVECKALRNFRGTFELSVYAEAAPGRSAAAHTTFVRIVRTP